MGTGRFAVVVNVVDGLSDDVVDGLADNVVNGLVENVVDSVVDVVVDVVDDVLDAGGVVTEPAGSDEDTSDTGLVSLESAIRFC